MFDETYLTIRENQKNSGVNEEKYINRGRMLKFLFDLFFKDVIRTSDLIDESQKRLVAMTLFDDIKTLRIRKLKHLSSQVSYELVKTITTLKHLVEKTPRTNAKTLQRR